MADPIIARAVKLIRPLLNKLGGKDDPATSSKVKDGVYGKKSFTAGEKPHSVWVKMTHGQAEIWIASTPREATAQINALEAAAKTKNISPLVADSIQLARNKVASAKTVLSQTTATR